MQVTKLTDRLSNFSVQVDKLEQYSRQNCLLIHSIEGNQNEKTDIFPISIIDEHFGLDI